MNPSGPLERDAAGGDTNPMGRPGAASTAETDPRRHIVFQGDRPGTRTAPDPATSAARATGRWVARDEPPLAADLERFYQKLFGLHDLRVQDYRTGVLNRRVAACLRALRAADLAEADALLASDSGARHHALRAVMIGVTAFFRDPKVFESIAAHVRALVDLGRAAPRILSVGCSDGSELYSVAMLLREIGVGPNSLDGIDCREDAIRGAAAGVYSRETIRELPAELVRRYFRPYPYAGPGAVRVIDEIRESCLWRRTNAFDLVGTVPYDLILCRNLFIYLTPAAAKNLWARLATRLRTGGLLIAGKAERPPEDLALHRLGACVYQKSGAIP